MSLRILKIKLSIGTYLLKNSISVITKTASIEHFIKQKQDGELIFQQL